MGVSEVDIESIWLGIGLRCYHNIDCINTSGSDSGSDRCHDVSISEVNMEICRCWKFQPIEEAHLESGSRKDL